MVTNNTNARNKKICYIRQDSFFYLRRQFFLFVSTICFYSHETIFYKSFLKSSLYLSEDFFL